MGVHDDYLRCQVPKLSFSASLVLRQIVQGTISFVGSGDGIAAFAGLLTVCIHFPSL